MEDVLGAILVLATMNVDAKIKILEEALELAGVVINPIANTIQCVTGQEVLKALGIVSLNKTTVQQTSLSMHLGETPTSR